MKALVVDDDRVLADLVAFTLRREGFQVTQAQDGETAIRKWSEETPDIIILDLNLPNAVPPLNGFEVLSHIRKTSDTPIILLSVRGEEEDIVEGLSRGADDYIHKPFSPRQLVARIQAVLRRAGRSSAPAIQQVGDLALDLSRREAWFEQGERIALTALECRLLDYLMTNAGIVSTYDAIISHVWGPGGADRDMLRQLVRRLRLKIEPEPSTPTVIETIPGLGYGLVRDRKPGKDLPLDSRRQDKN
jgi:DNA-binding response OmpR family regulator